MLTSLKNKVTHFFYPSALEAAIKQNKADEAIALITHASIPIDIFYGNFTLLGVAVIWRCDKLTVELVKRGANLNLEKIEGSSSLQVAVSATGDAEDLATAILFVAHGASVSKIDFYNNPEYRRVLPSIAETYLQYKKIEKCLRSNTAHYFQQDDASLCIQLSNYWRDIAKLLETRPIYKEYCLSEAAKYAAKAQRYPVIAEEQEEESPKNSSEPLLRRRAAPSHK